MAYVRRRGNQVAIVHGVRDPGTKKVEQEVLFTLYSKAEAIEAIGAAEPSSAARFRSLLEHRYNTLKFDWDEIKSGIRDNLEHLPESYDYRESRLKGHFRDDLVGFAKQLMFADPQDLDSSAWVIDQHRDELTFVSELIKWRLETPPAKANDWTSDNRFLWRHALQRGVPPEIEEMAAEYYEKGEPTRALGAFKLLTEAFPDYADGQNYLGLLALEARRLDEAQKHFEAATRLGRKLLPKRVSKASWWTDHATRPYMRGLMNLTLTLVQSGQYDAALRTCDLLENECHEVETSAAHRAAIHLNRASWLKARAAALRIHQLMPSASIVAAMAAFELGSLVEARVLFLHAALNVPRAVAMLVGVKGVEPSPASHYEVSDHNGGITLRYSLSGYLAKQSPAAKRFFAAQWKDEQVAKLRTQLEQATRRWDADRTGADRKAFDTMTRMRRFEFALEMLGTPELKGRPPRRRELH